MRALITTGYVARVAVDAITYAMGHSSTANHNAPTRKEKIRFDPFLVFTSNVVHRSEVKVPAVLVSLDYIKRAKEYLFIRPQSGLMSTYFWGHSYLPIKSVLGFVATPATLTLGHSMSTTGRRSRTITGPRVLGYSADATSAVSNANSSMFSIGIFP